MSQNVLLEILRKRLISGVRGYYDLWIVTTIKDKLNNKEYA